MSLDSERHVISSAAVGVELESVLASCDSGPSVIVESLWVELASNGCVSRSSGSIGDCVADGLVS